jgi:CheY-like chemotaxis protein
LRIGPNLQSEIEAKAPETAIRALARKEGMTLLREDAVNKIERGLTTPDEVTRIVQISGRELRCPQCSKGIDGKFAACPYCLYELHVRCEVCGAALEKQWNSCPYCGPGKAQPREAAPPIPMADAPTAASKLDVGGLGTIDVPHVLIVDDNDEIRQLTRMSLQRGIRPIRCDEAANGFEALGKIEAAKPHLIILDLMMPDMDGIELCKRLRAKLSTALVPVIMLTARGDAETKELGFLAGTDDYLTKPFERAELVARVQRLLERTYGWVREARTPVAAASG